MNSDTIKRHIKNTLTRSGVLSLAARALPKQIAILRYHSVQDEPQRHANSIGAGIIHSTRVFEQQMQIVAQQNDPVTLDDVVKYLVGETRLPRRPVAITFDDGFADNFEIAAPILQKYGIRASFYVTVDPIDSGAPWFCRLRHAFGTTRRQFWPDSAAGCTRSLLGSAAAKAAFLCASERCARATGQLQDGILKTIEEELEVESLAPAKRLMMTWDQVRSLSSAGHIVGSHTLTHPNLACVGPAELLKECKESKEKLERELGRTVDHLSYPSPILQPHWTENTVETTAAVGYRSAVTSTSGSVERRHNPLALQRLTVPSDVEQFTWVLERGLMGRWN